MIPVQRDTMYMRNKFVPQPYVPNELNLKQRVEPTLPPDQVVDMVKEQPYWKGSMVRPSTLHTPSSLVMGPVATLQVMLTYQEIMLIRRYTSLDIDICQKGFRTNRKIKVMNSQPFSLTDIGWL